MAGVALTALLTELKHRSGLSYEQLGRKTHLSRATVHRYCTGRSVPATFAPVEAIATACQASAEDRAKLYRLWERANLGRDAVRELPPAVEVAEVRPRTRPATTVALALALAVVLLAGGSLATRPDEPPAATPGQPRPLMWTNAPRELEPEFVGVTTNSNTGKMPTFRVGSARLWDTRTRWQNLEPSRGQFRWDTLDRLVRGARGAGLPVVMTFGGTPEWASPDGPRTVYTDESRTSPPDDLADWDHFVRAVAERYRGRIGAYELWDMANHPSFFSGSTADLVEMTRRASAVIRSVDRDAVVVCPSMGELWDAESLAELREFAELGGYDHCDAGAVKLSARTAADPPETMLPLAREIEKALHRGNAGIDLWSTGTAYDVNVQSPIGADRGADHAVRFYLAGLYAQYRRMYFYNWGSSRVPIVLQPVDGPATKAARYVDRLQGWLAGSRIHSCGQGRPAGLPDGLWQCRFDHDGRAFLIWWTMDQRLTVSAPPGATSVERLDGTTTPAGADIAVSGSPVLLRL